VVRRRLSGIQQRIRWEIWDPIPIEALRQKIGYPDRSNFCRSIKNMERRGLVETWLEPGEGGVARRVVSCDFRAALATAASTPISAYDTLDTPDRLEPFDLDDQDEEDLDPKALAAEVREAAQKPLPGDEPYAEGPDFTPKLLEGLRRAMAQAEEDRRWWPFGDDVPL